MRLCLGVVDIPYADKEGETTYEVAKLLEEKYAVMGTFFDIHGKDIAEDLESGIAGAIEDAFAGVASRNIFAGAMSKTEARFKEYIDKEEHGIRLKKHDAPKAGGRKKRQYRKVKNTNAFIWTGMYRMSFRSWITE